VIRQIGVGFLGTVGVCLCMSVYMGSVLRISVYVVICVCVDRWVCVC
jgi:hypothetical protein